MEHNKIDYLLDLMDNKTTLKNITRNNKKAYKFILTGIFINFINGKNHEEFQNDLFEKAEYIKLAAKKGGEISNQGLQEIRQAVEQSLQKSLFVEPNKEETTTKAIGFFRDKLNDIKKGKTLFQVLEISDLIDIKTFFDKRGTPNLHMHHWLDFNFEYGLIHTTPVFILLGDLKIHWNNYIESMNRYRELQIKLVPHIGQYDFDNIFEVKEIRHSYSGHYRTMIFTSVAFVEGFLLDILINIKEVSPEQKDKFPILNYSGNVSDKQIIEDLIYAMFPSIKGKTNNLYENYKELLNYRDRYVHASSYKEEHTNLSQLQYLLEFESNKVKEYLNSCIKLVKIINDELPESIQSLYWWERFEEPNFTKEEKVSLLNMKQQSKKLKEYEALL